MGWWRSRRGGIRGAVAGVLVSGMLATLWLVPADAAIHPATAVNQPDVLRTVAQGPLAAPLRLRPFAAAKLPSELTATADLRLRAGSNTKARILLVIPRGATVKVTGRASNGWYKVTYKSRTGWASDKYLSVKKTTAPKKLPSIPLAHQNSGPNKSSRVVLTYDDCPRTLAAFTAVIEHARRNNIGLALAPTGDCLAAFRKRHGVDLADLARSRGQWVINHSVSHPDLRKLSCARGAQELRGTGVRTNFGRPPYGAINDNVRCAYATVDMGIWTWTRDTLDWMVRSKTVTVQKAGAAKPGDTVLMHMQWEGFSPDSIRQISGRLKDRGVGLCRSYHGTDGRGPVAKTPVMLPSKLPC